MEWHSILDIMAAEQELVPKEFYDLVDRFIHLANDLTRDHATSRISSVILYAAARYNAHCLLALDPEAAQNRAVAADYFVEQYCSMLNENIDALMHASSRPHPNAGAADPGASRPT